MASLAVVSFESLQRPIRPKISYWHVPKCQQICTCTCSKCAKSKKSRIAAWYVAVVALDPQLHRSPSPSPFQTPHRSFSGIEGYNAISFGYHKSSYREGHGPCVSGSTKTSLHPLCIVSDAIKFGPVFRFAQTSARLPRAGPELASHCYHCGWHKLFAPPFSSPVYHTSPRH